MIFHRRKRKYDGLSDDRRVVLVVRCREHCKNQGHDMIGTVIELLTDCMNRVSILEEQHGHYSRH